MIAIPTVSKWHGHKLEVFQARTIQEWKDIAQGSVYIKAGNSYCLRYKVLANGTVVMEKRFRVRNFQEWKDRVGYNVYVPTGQYELLASGAVLIERWFKQGAFRSGRILEVVQEWRDAVG